MCCPKEEQKTIYNQAAQVARGWYYLAAGVNDELSAARMKFCYNCPHLVGGLVCNLCGCEAHAKTRLPEQQCPDKPPRWLSQTPPNEQQKTT
jgi:hypothetical protein